jgi:glyoxylase-like metal-dependent hydrolase (beta-lactamase superfamily II)
VQELRPGLWRWTTRHPEWPPGGEPGSEDDWPPDVGSVGYAGPDAFVLIDPLVDQATWPRLDDLVAAHGKQVSVLTTVRWHERSAAEATARYDAARTPPESVRAFPIERADETVYWIEEHGALVPGDRLLNYGRGLFVCPESWLDYIERIAGSKPSGAELREALRPLLQLPIELVLVSHGEPVLANGHAALASALAT